MTDEERRSLEKELERKIEQKIERKLKNNIPRILEIVFGIFFAALFLFLFNYYYDDIQFITRDFDPIRDLYNISLITSIVLTASRLFIASKAYREVTELITNIFFLIIAYYLWTVFPFDTSVIGNPKTWNFIFKGLILLPSIAVIMAIVARALRLLSRSFET